MRKHSALAAAVLAAAMTSCSSQDDFAPAAAGQVEVPVTATITVPDENPSRTSLNLGTGTDAGDLVWAWTVGDVVVATDAQGNYKGSLAAAEVDAQNPKKAVFDGTLNVTQNEIGTKIDLNFHYLGAGNTSTLVREKFTADYSAQSGELADLVKNDVLTSDKAVEVNVGAAFTQIPEFYLAHTTAVARLGIEGLPEGAQVATVTVSGDNLANGLELNLADRTVTPRSGNITVAGKKDFFLTMVPAAGVKVHVDVTTTDGNVYAGDLKKTDGSIAAIDVKAEKYYRKNELHLPLPVVLTSQFQYTLLFDANGGQDAPAALSADGPGAGSYTFTVPAAEPAYGRAHTFLGWADNAAATKAAYTAGDQVTVTKDAPSKTLYAVWDNVTVGVYANYYDGESLEYTDMTFTALTEAPFTHDFTVWDAIEKDGYDFKGWLADIDNKVYQPGETFTLNCDAADTDEVNFTAQWAKIETWTLAFNANGAEGAADKTTLTQQSSAAQVTFTIPADYTYAGVQGLEFLGWAKDAAATEADYKAGDNVTVSQLHTTLYAVWKNKTTNGTGGDFSGVDPTL